jgi:hypothetical protein
VNGLRVAGFDPNPHYRRTRVRAHTPVMRDTPLIRNPQRYFRMAG